MLWGIGGCGGVHGVMGGAVSGNLVSKHSHSLGC